MDAEHLDQLPLNEVDEYWMAQALALADKAEAQGEVPVGAVIVRQNVLIAEGWNQTIQSHDPTAHAEVVALRAAGQKLGNYRLNETCLYVTLEPCPMCISALIHARVARVVYGARDEKTGAVVSCMALQEHSSFNHRLLVGPQSLSEQCSKKLSDFFKRRRQEIKQAKIINRSKKG